MADDPKPQEGPGVSLEALHALLDAEISQALTAESRPGWTEWVIVASLGAIGWAMLGQFTEPIRPHPTAVAATAIVACLDAILAAHRLLDPPYAQQQRFRRAEDFAIGKSFAIAQAIRLAVMTYAVGKLEGHTVMLAAIAYGVAALLAALLPFMEFSGDVIRPSKWPLASRAFLGTAVVISTLAAAGAFSWLKTNVTLAELRVGALCAAATYLLLLLLHRRRTSPLLGELIRIRRALVLGRLKPELAARETETALLGMSASHVMQNWIQHFSTRNQNARNTIVAAQDQIDAVKLRLAELAETNSLVSAADRKMMRATLHSAMGQLDTVKDARASWNGEVIQMRTYAQTIHALQTPEYGEIEKQLSDARAQIEEEARRMADQVLEARALPALADDPTPKLPPASTE